jgi:hypothetical protein
MRFTKEFFLFSQLFIGIVLKTVRKIVNKRLHIKANKTNESVDKLTSILFFVVGTKIKP